MDLIEGRLGGFSLPSEADAAQAEIRAYANTIGEKIVSQWVPSTWEAFLDYSVNAMSLSRLEREIIAAIASGGTDAALKRATAFGWLEEDAKGGIRRNRERAECEEKLKQLKLKAPWR